MKKTNRRPYGLPVGLLRHAKALTVFAIVFLLIFLLAVSFLSGVFFYRAAMRKGSLNTLVRQKILPIKKTNYKMVLNYFKGLMAYPLEHIDIDVKFMDFQRLAYQREQVYRNKTAWEAGGVVYTYVPAEIRHNGKTVKAEIRLKGDTPAQHLTGDKWSFRIKVKGEDTLFGMKKFSIHRPSSRGHIYEWLFHKALEREGIISLRYKFVDVALNGKRLGIYALEEHFDKLLIESNRRREGVIVKFDEDLMFASGGLYQTEEVFLKSFQNSHIDAFQMRKIARQESLLNQFKAAATLLSRFRSGELKTSDVFDVDLMAKHAALSELLGAHHGMYWYNRRFYYNPVTSRLEPIGFDADAVRRIRYLYCNKPPWRPSDTPGHAHVHAEKGSFTERLFSDPIFIERYIGYLEEMVQPSYVDALFADLDEELKKNINIIYKEEPYFAFSPEDIYANREYIRKVLNPIKAAHAYFNGASDNFIQLEVGNIHLLPLKVVSASYKDSVNFATAKEITLDRTEVFGPVKFQTVKFLIPEGMAWNDEMVGDLKLNCTIVGTSKMRKEPVFFWPRRDIQTIEEDLMRKEANYHLFDFLQVDKSEKTITIKPGHWKVTEDIVIPPDFNLVALKGVQLDLRNSATILSYSPCYFIGVEEDPIVVKSGDSTGGGLVVIKAGKESRLKYVVFDNLAAPRRGRWELTGAVTFYESGVEILHCRFVKNRNSDDALNIVRSDFDIESSIFNKTYGDAFDADFSKGRIANSQFIDCGNDGIDVCETFAAVEDIFISGAKDKGISVGEKSRIEVSGTRIENAKIAIAAKDSSHIDFVDSAIANCKVGFALYQKKPEFGPATANISALDKGDISGVDDVYLVEEGSSLTIDGTAIKADQKNLYKKLESGP